MANRKLLMEMDRTSKETTRALQDYDEMNKKLLQSLEGNHTTRSEKLFLDLKRDHLGKVIRLRHQVKVWLDGNESDHIPFERKQALGELKTLCEARMEDFDRMERVYKTRGFRKDEEEDNKTITWVKHVCEEMRKQKEVIEGELEMKETSANKKGNSQREELKARLDDLTFHLFNLELILRGLTNRVLEEREIDELQRDLQEFLAGDLDLDEYSDFYEHLDLNSKLEGFIEVFKPAAAAAAAVVVAAPPPAIEEKKSVPKKETPQQQQQHVVNKSKQQPVSAPVAPVAVAATVSPSIPPPSSSSSSSVPPPVVVVSTAPAPATTTTVVAKTLPPPPAVKTAPPPPSVPAATPSRILPPAFSSASSSSSLERTSALPSLSELTMTSTTSPLERSQFQWQQQQQQEPSPHSTVSTTTTTTSNTTTTANNSRLFPNSQAPRSRLLTLQKQPMGHPSSYDNPPIMAVVPPPASSSSSSVLLDTVSDEEFMAFVEQSRLERQRQSLPVFLSPHLIHSIPPLPQIPTSRRSVEEDQQMLRVDVSEFVSGLNLDPSLVKALVQCAMQHGAKYELKEVQLAPFAIQLQREGLSLEVRQKIVKALRDRGIKSSGGL